MSGPRAPGVHDARRDEWRAVYRSLALAFEDDPVTAFLFPRARTRVARLERLYDVLIPRLVAEGRLLTDDEHRAASVWQGPDPSHTSHASGVATLLRLGVVLRSRVRAGLALAAALERARVRERHWYLGILGAAPAHQGMGLGSALMRPVLDDCDAEGVVAYLESSKRSNIPFYERHGFAVIDEIAIDGGPPLWPMRREPRGRTRRP
ncbi:MAG: GNAT family N-acetyltransferase [Myxococcota bacterium]